MSLVTRRSRDVSGISGPLLFVDIGRGARLGETVRVELDGRGARAGQVIELDGARAVIQLLEDSQGLSPARAEVELSGRLASLPVARGMLGRTFDGMGRPRDGLPPIVPEAVLPIGGAPLNPVRRDRPSDFIETGVSAIDGLNTLVRGQKLPIFSGAGLPAPELASRIVRGARVASGDPFAVVFVAMGIPFREADAYRRSFEDARERVVVFLNLADDPTIERLMAPRCALTCAEHLAIRHGMHVLVVMTDMTSYCEALREVSLARDEIPARRGFPGTLYTDLASLYERAGRVKGRPGSVTQLPILTMPDDDITHPIPDLTGYVTEGQIVLSRELERRRVSPPIDVLPSLSRLMNLGVGAGRTREDHRAVADQLYALYARGREVRRMEAVVGSEGLGVAERRALELADRFERELVNQGGERRTIEETLAIGWRLLATYPPAELTRVKREHIERYLPRGGADGAPAGDPHGPAR